MGFLRGTFRGWLFLLDQVYLEILLRLTWRGRRKDGRAGRTIGLASLRRRFRIYLARLWFRLFRRGRFGDGVAFGG